MTIVALTLVSFNLLLLLLAVTPLIVAVLILSTISLIVSATFVVLVVVLAGVIPVVKPIVPFAVPVPINKLERLQLICNKFVFALFTAAVIPLIPALLIWLTTCVIVRFGVEVVTELVADIVSVTLLKPTSAFAVPALITKLKGLVGVLVVFVILKKLLVALAVTLLIPAPVILFTISVNV